MTPPDMPDRRDFLKYMTAAGGTLVLGRFVTGCGAATAQLPRRTLASTTGTEIDLSVAETRLLVGGRPTMATTVNGGIPGPEIRLREGDDVLLRVRNDLTVDTSIHWHGLLVPAAMDGVPELSFPGIPPGDTFEYRFPIVQNGTYWYHSHSGFQEQTGVYGPLIIDPREPSSEEYDREFTIILSDWTFESPERVFANLKRYGGYYNYQRRTLANLGEERRAMGGGNAVRGRLRWSRMRMDASDISDVTGVTYTYLCNGLSPDENWRGIFTPGERVRLRFINAGAGTYFDVRIPGVPMRVIQADGIDVVPVEVDEFRIAIAETFDVIVEPGLGAHTIFAEAKDRSGYARGTLSTDEESTAPVPERRPRPLLTMDDMGMDMSGMDMGGRDMGGMDMSGMDMGGMDMGGMDMSGMDHDAMNMSAERACAAGVALVANHDNDSHGGGNSMVAAVARSRIDDPGVGLRDADWRVLTYADLRRATPTASPSVPQREIELHLTGNMERYMWSFDGESFDEHTAPIMLRRGECVRFVLINDTMMAHPIHLHGTFFELDVGACEANPLKHTVNVKPAERVSFIVSPHEVGRWAFHCHILYHMDAGMFRVVEVTA